VGSDSGESQDPQSLHRRKQLSVLRKRGLLDTLEDLPARAEAEGSLSKRQQKFQRMLNYHMRRPEDFAKWRKEQIAQGADIRRQRELPDGPDDVFRGRTYRGPTVVHRPTEPPVGSAGPPPPKIPEVGPFNLRGDTPTFTEHVPWYRRPLAAFSRGRDRYTFGTLGVEVRDLTIKSGQLIKKIKEDAQLTDDILGRRLNTGLYEYLFKEKLPRSEYMKNGVFDPNLCLLHMVKLTKQYYSKFQDRYAHGKEFRDYDAYTQRHVVDEKSKDVLWAEHNVCNRKYHPFFSALHLYLRAITRGVLIGCLLLTACLLFAATARHCDQLLSGNVHQSIQNMLDTIASMIPSVASSQCRPSDALGRPT
jgi:hypothetical protein